MCPITFAYGPGPQSVALEPESYDDDDEQKIDVAPQSATTDALSTQPPEIFISPPYQGSVRH